MFAMLTINRLTFPFHARVACAAVLLSLAPVAQAAWQPDKPVQVYIGVAAGGALDTTARAAQAIWQTQKLIATPIVVENKPGAGGSIALNALASQAGNGHVIAFTSPTLITNQLMGTSKLGLRDFTPIALLSTDYIAFVVRADSPIRTGKELLAHLKDPKFNIGNATQAGNSNHIALAAVAKTSGLDPKSLTVALYKSGGDSMIALVGGHVDLVVTAASNALPQVRAGTVRVVAVAASKRLPGVLADVPTWKEQGVDVVYGLWRGVIGPKGMSPDQLAYWSEVFGKTAASPEWKATLSQTYSEDSYLPSAAFVKFLDQESAQQQRALKDLGIAN